MKIFGKCVATFRTVEIDEKTYNVILYLTSNGDDIVELLQKFPHPFYIAVNDSGVIFMMTHDPEQIQIDKLTIIGIDSDFGFTYGQGGNVYGKVWNGTEIVAPEPLPDTIPEKVSRFQARAALHLAGLLAEVEAAIEGADELVKIAWADAQEFRRDSPTILAMADMLELSSFQVDELFIQAAKIEA